ncbi:cytochrome d ubiquinol oxidase subunit II, partial [Klebsiella pneumoniae]|uniref:cytochrome d ubiquinol oxidase subunit II n=1 Tax=Klebsiella pneumoniae TaxID=573 RepID=UPI0019527A72
RFFRMLPIPVITVCLFGLLAFSLRRGHETMPFIVSMLIFLMGFIGIAMSLWPWAVPYQVTIWSAAAAPESLSLLLVGVTFLLPLILFYTGYC